MNRKSKPRKNVRSAPRVALDLPMTVPIKEEGRSWKEEVTTITTISHNGVGFSSSRECKVGRLVELMIPMPPELRAYDQTEEFYPIVGLVQYCNKTTEGDNLYHIGVALTGKQVPESFTVNPMQSYRINGMSDDGLWNITEAEIPFTARRDPRFGVSLDVTVTLLQKDRKLISKETTVTQNVSASGASILCSLDARIGDKVKLACKALNFYAIAKVRNRIQQEGRSSTVHLEFVETRFPIEKLGVPQHTETLTDVEVSLAEGESSPGSSQSSETREFEFERY